MRGCHEPRAAASGATERAGDDTKTEEVTGGVDGERARTQLRRGRRGRGGRAILGAPQAFRDVVDDLARGRRGVVEPLTLGGPGGQALALFGFAEEAALYLRLAGPEGDGWWVRESSPGEVTSMLFGPCAGENVVALDPLPGMAADGTLCLVCMEKRRFLARLLGAGT